MSAPARSHDNSDERRICDYCGGYIDYDGQLCPALDQGECRP